MNFFDIIFDGDVDGYVQVANVDLATGGFVNKDWYEWPKQRDDVIRRVETYAEVSDCLYSPMIYSAPVGKATANITRQTKVVWQDADTCAPENFRVTPSIVVKTSPGHWHCYWILDEWYMTSRLEDIITKISYAHKDQGSDLSSYSPVKLMRVPETINTKHGSVYMTSYTDTGLIYSLEELEEAYADVEVTHTQATDIPFPKELPDRSLVVARAPEISMVQDLLHGEPTPGEELSSKMWMLSCELFRHDFTPEEVFVAVQGSAFNKYRRPIGELKADGSHRTRRKNPDLDLWRDVTKAHAAVRETENVVVGEPATEIAPAVNLLSDYERDLVVQNEDSPINIWKKFADSYTDGDQWHKYAMGWTILSCVFGEEARILFKWGDTPLNLWFLALGDTTVSRKSTIYDIGKDFLREWQNFSGKDYDIGGNATPEALIELLSERDGQVSLYHIDECQQFLGDLKSKGYMANADNTFTELYGGNVPQMTRRSGSTQKAKTILSMYFLGVPQKVMEELDVSYYQKGFIPRFIPVLADYRTLDSLSAAVPFGDPDKYKGLKSTDPALVEITKVFQKARNRFMKLGSPFPKLIVGDEDVQKRLNDVNLEIIQFAQKHRYADVLVPTFQRMIISMVKAAALLAVWDGEQFIRMKHFNEALWHAEKWIQDAIKMASSVSTTQWEKQGIKLLDYLDKRGGKAPKSMVHDKVFPEMRRFEFDELVTTLEARGRMKTTTVPGKQGRYLSVETS